MGYTVALRPNSHMYSTSLLQRTQILYTPDISMILWRLNLKPGMKVVESGTGTGSLSTSIARAIFPTGHLYTYEFNKYRHEKSEEDFEKTGLSRYVTATHRDVLGNGFLLDDKVTKESVDAVFLDLPKPEEAVKHAYEVLKTKGKLCNFSPCIEQVQKATQEMAKLGFYDIRTFESLCKEVEMNTFPYKSINHIEDDAPEEPEKVDKSYAKKGKNKGKNEANKRKAKHFDKTMHPVSG